MPEIRLPLGTKPRPQVLNSNGKVQTLWEAYAKFGTRVYNETQLGKDYQKIANLVNFIRAYGPYGAAAYLSFKLVRQVVDTYRWFKVTDNSRERTRLAAELKRLNKILGSDVNIIDIVQRADNEADVDSLVRGKVIKRRQLPSRSRSRSRYRSRSRSRSRNLSRSRYRSRSLTLPRLTAKDEKILARLQARMDK